MEPRDQGSMYILSGPAASPGPVRSLPSLHPLCFQLAATVPSPSLLLYCCCYHH